MLVSYLMYNLRHDITAQIRIQLGQTALILLESLLNTQQHRRLPVVKLCNLIILVHLSSKAFDVRLLTSAHELVREFCFPSGREGHVLLGKGL